MNLGCAMSWITAQVTRARACFCAKNGRLAMVVATAQCSEIPCTRVEHLPRGQRKPSWGSACEAKLRRNFRGTRKIALRGSVHDTLSGQLLRPSWEEAASVCAFSPSEPCRGPLAIDEGDQVRTYDGSVVRFTSRTTRRTAPGATLAPEQPGPTYWWV